MIPHGWIENKKEVISGFTFSHSSFVNKYFLMFKIITPPCSPSRPFMRLPTQSFMHPPTQTPLRPCPGVNTLQTPTRRR